MPKILDTDNLYIAYWKARRGKEGKAEVRRYAATIDVKIRELQQQITTGDIPACNYRTFTIYDPKERIICAAPFKFRVLHHALMNICGPLLDKRLISDSYASRMGMGTYAALSRARIYYKRYAYCVKMDIKKYFDSIDHTILKQQLYCVFKEEKLLSIFYDIIDSYEASPNKGLPIGNLTSQYFANHYLCGLDHYAKENLKIPGYVRYMDDILLYGNDRQELLDQAKHLRTYLEQNLSLKLKVFDIRKATTTTQFLGYRLTQQGDLLLSRRSKQRYKNKLAQYFYNYNHNEWNEEELHKHLMPLIGFVMKAKSNETRRCSLHRAI